jgi:NADP-dependent 3-hydroxy acid dehydrogenase YdfG
MANTAIVTGASRGIGRSIARRLASDGLSVVVNNAGSVKDAEETVSEIKSAGGRAVAVAGDISQANDVTELFAKAAQAFGPIQVVVNSAGIMPLSPIVKSDIGSFDKVIAINLRGAFLVLAQAAQHVIEAGRIIALSSSVIAKSFPTYGAYIASKAAFQRSDGGADRRTGMPQSAAENSRLIQQTGSGKAEHPDIACRAGAQVAQTSQESFRRALRCLLRGLGGAASLA